MADLNEKQMAFCREYIIDLNMSQAAIRAGYSEKTAGAIGSRLLKNVKVMEMIDRLKADREKRTGVTADDVVRQLAKIAFMDIKRAVDWETTEINQMIGKDEKTGQKVYHKTPVTRLALKPMAEVDGTLIQSVKMTKHGIAVEFPDRMKAMEMLAKHLGVYDERPQTTVNVEGYKAALWERANAGDVWSGFNNGGPDPEGEEDGKD